MRKTKKPQAAGLAAAIIIASLALACCAEVILTDATDKRIQDALNPNTHAIGFEPTIAVHPSDWRILLMALNAPSTSAGWYSTDGGSQWHGDNQPAHSPGQGDPSVTILKAHLGDPARYLIQDIATHQSNPPPQKTGQRVIWTDSPSGPWPQANTAFVVQTEDTDRGVLCADNATSPPRLYSTWFRPASAGLRFRFSTDRGVSWLPVDDAITIHPSGYCWGGVLNIAFEPPSLRGHVYVAWPRAASRANGPGSITFKRSIDGITFVPSGGVEVINYGGRSFRFQTSNPAGANSAPSIATDDLGNIYVAWCQQRILEPGVTDNDAQVYVAKSSDEGNTWTSTTPLLPVSVTASTANQWLPWISWDDEVKALAVIYLDDRNNATQAETYLAVSYDRGASYRELKISDAPGTEVFIGDYIGVACAGGIANTVWCDARASEAGVVKAFTSPTLLGGIESTSIVPTVTHHCGGPLNPRVIFQVDWLTLLKMEGNDKLIVTRPGGSQSTVTAWSTSTEHQLTSYDLGCINGTWTFQVESSKGAGISRSAAISVAISCLNCPPCSPPCELE